MNTPESDPSPPRAPGLQVEVGATSRRRVPMLWIVLPLVALVAAGIWAVTLVANRQVVSPSPPVLPSVTTATPRPAPTVTWSENPLDVILSPGETASRTLTLTSDRKVGKLRLCISSTLAPFLNINVLDKHDLDAEAEEDDALEADEPEDPTEATIEGDADPQKKKDCKGKHFKLNPRKPLQSVEFTFSIPPGTVLGTYEGTIDIWRGKRMLPQTLPITLNVWRQIVSVEQGYRIAYEPDMGISDVSSTRPAFVSGVRFSTADDSSSVSVLVYENSELLPVQQWYQTTLADREYRFVDSASRTLSTVLVSGVSSLQVRSTILGHINLRTFVPHGARVFGIETSVPDDTDVSDEYFRMLATFRAE